MKKAISCDKEQEWKLAIHLVWKSEYCNFPNFEVLTPSEVDCQKAMESINNTQQSNFADYPPNTLRNIARQGSHTEFQLLSDMENFVSTGAESILRNALQKIHGKEKQNAVIIVR